jgi:hypothetical protein
MEILNWVLAKRRSREETTSGIGCRTGRMGTGAPPTAFENLLVMAEYAHPSNSGSIFMAASYELPIARTFPVIRLVFSFTDGNIQNNIVLSHLAITSDGNLRSRPLCLNLN